MFAKSVQIYPPASLDFLKKSWTCLGVFFVDPRAQKGGQRNGTNGAHEAVLMLHVFYMFSICVKPVAVLIPDAFVASGAKRILQKCRGAVC